MSECGRERTRAQDFFHFAHPGALPSKKSLELELEVTTIRLDSDISHSLRNQNAFILTGHEKSTRADHAIAPMMTAEANMLLEILSGLRFTELDVNCTNNRLPPLVFRIAEACYKTRVP